MNRTERITSILPGPRQPNEVRLDENEPICCLPVLLPCGQETCASQVLRQAVRSLGPRSCACYQASTRGLSTRSSPWDLHSHLTARVGRLILEPASRLDAFSAYLVWT